MEYTLLETPPAPQEYVDLRIRAGLSAKSLESAEIGLPNSLYAVQLRMGGELIAMGRVIGDGACFFQVVDIAARPGFQGHGLGRVIMEHIDAYLQQITYPGSHVSLIADEPKFYEKFGYRPTAPAAKGMYKQMLPIE